MGEELKLKHGFLILVNFILCGTIERLLGNFLDKEKQNEAFVVNVGSVKVQLFWKFIRFFLFASLSSVSANSFI